MNDGRRPRARKSDAETPAAGTFLPRFGNFYGERVAYTAGGYDVFYLNFI